MKVLLVMGINNLYISVNRKKKTITRSFWIKITLMLNVARMMMLKAEKMSMRTANYNQYVPSYIY